MTILAQPAAWRGRVMASVVGDSSSTAAVTDSASQAMSVTRAVIMQTPARKAVYQPMATDRATRTPHSGYHFDGTSRRFFEGWYFQVAIPEANQSFAWMYTSENPGADVGGDGAAVEGPASRSSGAAQVMGADEEYLFQDAPTLEHFWGARHELALGNTYIPKEGAAPPKSEVDPKGFWDVVDEGYQVTPTWHQGCLRDNDRTDFAKTVKTIRWEYSTRPVYGWAQSETASWPQRVGWPSCLYSSRIDKSAWRVVYPQVCWIEWGEQRFEFVDASSYCEKNWAGSFPQKWFWLQCTVFDGFSGEVALTAGGGRRRLPFLKDAFEDVALICLHYQGKFYEFVPWEGKVEWEIAPWGSWKMSAKTKSHEVKLEETTDTPGSLCGVQL